MDNRPTVSTISSAVETRPNFAIVYNKPSAIFRTREFIEGSVVVNSCESITIRGIVVRCSGDAKVFWETGPEIRKRQHVNSEKYFDVLQQVFGESSDADHPAIALPPGQHQFPFSISIPTNIPSSFESHFGFVRYSCTAILELAKCVGDQASNCIKINKYEHEEQFVIKNSLDISTIPNGKNPVYFEGSKAMYALVWCWKMGYLIGKIKINQSAFVPKDKILISVEVRNTTMEPLRIFEVSLKKIITYSNKSGAFITDPHNQTVCSAGSNRLQPRTERCTISAAKQLRIPKKIPPTNLGGGCSIIQVSYYLRFILSLSSVESSNTSLRLNIPITIGTEDTGVQRFTQFLTPVPEPEMPFPAFPPDYDQLIIDNIVDYDRPPMPPSYDEATSSPDQIVRD